MHAHSLFIFIYIETGRTGRAGHKGKAVTFFTQQDTVNLRRYVFCSHHLYTGSLYFLPRNTYLNLLPQ